MRTKFRWIMAAGAVGLVAAMTPAVSALATSASPTSPSSSTRPAAQDGPSKEAKGFILFRGFPKGEQIKGGMGTIDDTCSSGNNGRPFDFTGDATLDATASHGGFSPFCLFIFVQSSWQLSIDSPAQFRGTVGFLLNDGGHDQSAMSCTGSSGKLKCMITGKSGKNGQIIVEPAS
jgi:hypothetical protein